MIIALRNFDYRLTQQGTHPYADGVACMLEVFESESPTYYARYKLEFANAKDKGLSTTAA